MARKIRRCRGPVNQLVMHRTKGLYGLFAQNIGGGTCVKGVGDFYGFTGPGHPSNTMPEPYLCLDFSKATLKPPTYPYLCCDYSRATLVPQRT